MLLEIVAKRHGALKESSVLFKHWDELSKFSCKVVVANSSCKRALLELNVVVTPLAEDAEVAVAAVPSSIESLPLAETLPRGGTGGGTFPDGTKFGFGGEAALLPLRTAG